GRQFTRGHAIWNPGKERKRRRLVLPVIGGAMAHLGCPVNHRIKRLQRRNQLSCGIDLNGQASARRSGDTVSKSLCTNTKPRKVLRPCRHHTPGNVTLSDCRRGKARCSCTSADSTGLGNKG